MTLRSIHLCVCESRCLNYDERQFHHFQSCCCNKCNRLVQMDETSAWAASRSNSKLKLDKGEEDNVKIGTSFFSLQAELFLSHFLLQILTSHYLKPLFLVVLAAGSLASLVRVSSKIHLLISSGALTFFTSFFSKFSPGTVPIYWSY